MTKGLQSERLDLLVTSILIMFNYDPLLLKLILDLM